MTAARAIEIRDRAIAHGLEDCCDECRSAIDRLRKIGSNNERTAVPNMKRDPAVATVGIGAEDAARWLTKHIGVPA